MIRTAWVSEAGLLAMRTAEQAAAGHGLRWNAAERVQAFDHPLWVMLLAAARGLTGETYLTVLAMSIVCSLAALRLLLRARSEAAALATAAAISLCPTFVAYSTSGTGTPLLHLIVAGIVVAAANSSAAPRPAWTCALLVGLGGLSHWSVAVALMPLVATLSRGWRPGGRLRLIAVALAPLLLWWTWAWWYYGAPLPNAIVADRTAGIAWTERLLTGAEFLAGTLRLDPLLVVLTIVGAAVGLASTRTSASLAVGALLLAAWAVVTGGSPEAGLGLTVPFVLAVGLLAEWLAERSGGLSLAVLAALVVAGALMPMPTYASDSSYGADRRRSAYSRDVRAEMYPATGLLLHNRIRRFPAGAEADRGRQMSAAGESVGLSEQPGLFAAGAGLSMHVVDPAATTDPLLARLPPSLGATRMWGAVRRVPEGYLQSLPDRSIAVTEPALASLAQDVRNVTRGSLLDAGRAGLLAGLPTRVESAVAKSSYGLVRVRIEEVAAGRPPFELREGGLLIEFPARTARTFAATMSARFEYTVEFFDGDRLRRREVLPRISWEDMPPTRRSVSLDRSQPLTAVLVQCQRGIGRCTLAGAELRD